MTILDLDLHKHKDKLRSKKEGTNTFIWDQIRKKYLVLQPEELVRQLIVLYLVHDLDYPIGKINIEQGLKVNQTQRRYDIIVRDTNFQPFLLIECKSHRTRLQQATFDQVSTYNMQLQAPYILITNGIQTICASIDRDQQAYKFVEIPAFPQ